ncbi:MAG: septum formation initiator family protein [Chitinophagaceae bacterium]|nr:septum formation initiator family protein [Chitinophagaceae bacterium]
MKLLTHLPAWLKNKYFISFAAFCVIMLFLDKNDLLTQLSRRRELHQNQQSKKYYTNELASLRKQAEALRTSPAALEKLAREKLLMKKDNEDLFIISEKPDNAKN